jgi:hypothetical protein
MSELPDILQDVAATLYDFNTEEQLAEGKADITFNRETDRLRVRRQLFEGEFRPNSTEEAEYVQQRLIAAISLGAPAMSLHVEYGGRIYVFIVKLELGDTAFPLTGRAEPKLT